MSSELTLEVQRRDERGKNENRRLRLSGKVPAVVYGGGGEPLPIQVNRRAVDDLLRVGGENPIFLLELEGTKQKRHTMIRELQQDPLTGGLLHIDFQRITMDEKVRVKVPIEVVGTPLGVKNEGGFVDFTTRELEVECLPGNIPEQIVADVSELHVGQHLEASDLPFGEGVILVDDPQRVVVSVAHARVVEEEVEELEGEELLEGVEEEPEVIGKGKEEDEEEG